MSEFVFDPMDGALRLALASILLVFAIILSRYRGIGVEKELLVGSTRALLQLAVIGLILTAIFENEMIIFMALMIAGMIVLGGYTSARRASGLPSPMKITLPSIAIGSSIVILFLTGIQVIPVRAEFVITIGGMAVGNSMNMCSLFLNNFKREMQSRHNEIEVRLALGASGEIALAPHLRFSIRSALIPTLDNLKTLGFVFIPGAMTGMIIGGADPVWAAEYQLIVFFMIITSGMIAMVLASKLVSRQIINPAQQIVEIG